MTSKAPQTRLIHLEAGAGRRTVNPPLERASTLLFDTREALYGAQPGYGRMGLAVHAELAEALGVLEGAGHVQLAPSGLAACALAIASVVRSGDHVLLPDSAYGPTRRFCQRRLSAMGVEATLYPPRIGADITRLMREETRAVFVESPGSLTFEVSDAPAIAGAAKSRGATTILDNTWSAGLFCKPLALGVDISVQALTKYAVGHADAFAGAVMTNDSRLATQLETCTADWGLSVGTEEAYAALRGLRTLKTRLDAHQASAMAIAGWLEARPEVDRVLHPGLASHPDHEVWRRDFSGASGLFGLVLAPCPTEALDAAISKLELFRLGFSWGGFESLLIPCDDQLKRSAGDWTKHKSGPLIRLHIGLEAVEDLKADLERFLDALAGTG